MADSHTKSPLLSGLNVLDLSLWQPGHSATQLFADLGATVVKIEPPEGDRMRPVMDRFYNFNAHKRSVTVNLKDPVDRERLYELVPKAEVVVVNFRPGVAERLGCTYDDFKRINPSIVVCSISGFGLWGPLSNATGHDRSFQAYAGAFNFACEERPIEAAMPVADQSSGLAAGFAILASLLKARATGEGEFIDLSMTDLIASWVFALRAVDPNRSKDVSPINLPAMGAFQTADDIWIELGIFSEDHLWNALCTTLSMDDAVGLSMASRNENCDQLRDRIAANISKWTAKDLMQSLEPKSVPIAPILTRDQAMAHPHFKARGLLQVGPDGYQSLGHPIIYSNHPALPAGKPPEIGEHNEVGFD